MPQRENRSNMEFHENCKRCQAPVFLNRTTDWYGNTVTTLNCWNGHYKWVKVDDVESDIKVDPKAHVVSSIGFFDIA